MSSMVSIRHIFQVWCPYVKYGVHPSYASVHLSSIINPSNASVHLSSMVSICPSSMVSIRHMQVFIFQVWCPYVKYGVHLSNASVHLSSMVSICQVWCPSVICKCSSFKYGVHMSSMVSICQMQVFIFQVSYVKYGVHLSNASVHLSSMVCQVWCPSVIRHMQVFKCSSFKYHMSSMVSICQMQVSFKYGVKCPYVKYGVHLSNASVHLSSMVSICQVWCPSVKCKCSSFKYGVHPSSMMSIRQMNIFIFQVWCPSVKCKCPSF